MIFWTFKARFEEYFGHVWIFQFPASSGYDTKIKEIQRNFFRNSQAKHDVHSYTKKTASKPIDFGLHIMFSL